MVTPWSALLLCAASALRLASVLIPRPVGRFIAALSEVLVAMAEAFK